MAYISKAKAAHILGCAKEDLKGLSQEELKQLVEHLSSIPKVEERAKGLLPEEGTVMQWLAEGKFQLQNASGQHISKEAYRQRWKPAGLVQHGGNKDTIR